MAKNSLKLIKKKSSKSLSKLTRELDTVFSVYIRLKYADRNGSVSCYTCPQRKFYKEMQNGHYISRKIKILRWDENNCRPQCIGCNIFHQGQPVTFRENLVKELTAPVVEKLEASRFQIFKKDPAWFEEKIEHYNQEVLRLSEYLDDKLVSTIL